MAVLSMPVAGSGTPAVGSGPNVARWAGAFGLASVVVFLLATPLYFIGPAQPTGATNGATLADFLTKTSAQVLTRTTIADPIIIGCFLVFLAGLRHLIGQARPDYEWLATLVFAVGVALSTLQLVADGLQGGAALDTSSRADPSVVRGLFEASYVFYGAIGLIVAALMLASAGAAILATGALPRWIGWLALCGAVVNLIAAPSIYGGTDYTAFYSASGWITYIAQLTWVAWFAIASVAMIRRREPGMSRAASTADRAARREAGDTR
jgi:hypothetical protein